MGINRKINQIGKPHFLCIGATRTATTWLHYCLSQHSQIYIPPRKELNYFGKYRFTNQTIPAKLLPNNTQLRDKNNKRNPYRKSTPNIRRSTVATSTTIVAICVDLHAGLSIQSLSTDYTEGNWRS